MFWSGNYIAARELNFLLKEENVTLSQVLEADDILQECKADNKALIQFLTRPEILAELITLITEEPPKNVELASQYRHANIACEVLTSQLSTLSDRLSLDTTQMNRLCDFLNNDPPLNPLLASYFSKTVEMLLERSPRQDCYLYHIVCLRVLDFFKSRRDFLPNLLRHMATSAIADTIKCFIRLDPFKKIVIEWLEDHQFLESLIQIICGMYTLEQAPAVTIRPPSDNIRQESRSTQTDEGLEKGELEQSEKERERENHAEENASNGEADTSSSSTDTASSPIPSHTAPTLDRIVKESRMRASAAANAAGLLADLMMNGVVGDSYTNPRSEEQVPPPVLGLAGSAAVPGSLLRGMFTCPVALRHTALLHGCQLLTDLVSHYHMSGCEWWSAADIEEVVAPHLPLLRRALTHPCVPPPYSSQVLVTTSEPGACGESVPPGATGSTPGPQGPASSAPGPQGPASSAPGATAPTAPTAPVGSARLAVVSLLARLALSHVEDVATTIVVLGIPGTLIDMFFSYPENNFLHAQVYAFIRNALDNQLYKKHYADHLFLENDLLNRLMDAVEENEPERLKGRPRAGYMGHVIFCLEKIRRVLDSDQHITLPTNLQARWTSFQDKLQPVLQLHNTPLGGYYPQDNVYEVDNMMDGSLEGTYQYNDMVTAVLDDVGEGLEEDEVRDMYTRNVTNDGNELEDGIDGDEKCSEAAENKFLEMSSQRFDDDMWEDGPDIELPNLEPTQEDLANTLAAFIPDVSPWDPNEDNSTSGAGEGWAQFGSDAFSSPADPFADSEPGRPQPRASQADGANAANQAAPQPDSQKDSSDLFGQDFDDFQPFVSCTTSGESKEQPTEKLEQNLRDLHLDTQTQQDPVQDSTRELTNNLLTAMSSMSADVIANIVNANLPEEKSAEDLTELIADKEDS